MIKCSSEVQKYGDKVEAVAQKYFNDIFLEKKEYDWDIGDEMEEIGLGRNDDYAESCIMQRLDEMKKNWEDSQVQVVVTTIVELSGSPKLAVGFPLADI